MEIVKTEPLSENGSFEKVVNAATSKRRKQAERASHVRFLNSLHRLAIMVIAFLFVVVLVSTNFIPDGWDVVAVSACLYVIGFISGRIFGK